MKARVLYDVIQDDMQKTISASDKDFPRLFQHMIVLSCYFIPRYYREEQKKEYVTRHFPEIDSREFKKQVARFSEKFLDDVYESKSLLPREEFLQLVARKTNYIFKSELVRARFSCLCENDHSSDDY